MGTLKIPDSASVFVVVQIMAENDGVVPGIMDSSAHVRQCIDTGLLSYTAFGMLIPTREGWERIEEWAWDETGRKALAFRPVEEDDPTVV